MLYYTFYFIILRFNVSRTVADKQKRQRNDSIVGVSISPFSVFLNLIIRRRLDKPTLRSPICVVKICSTRRIYKRIEIMDNFHDRLKVSGGPITNRSVLIEPSLPTHLTLTFFFMYNVIGWFKWAPSWSFRPSSACLRLMLAWREAVLKNYSFLPHFGGVFLLLFRLSFISLIRSTDRPPKSSWVPLGRSNRVLTSIRESINVRYTVEKLICFDWMSKKWRFR